ncbi:MAG: hypothetical protein AAFX53_14960 [Bacteroidota bacterium]
MKRIFGVLTLVLCFAVGCKQQKMRVHEEVREKSSILEKLAFAHGYGEWGKVTELQFTFNVDKDSSHFQRTWIWKPKVNQVTSISGSDTITYSRKAMDSVSHKINSGFINDKYWLMAPINLLWDKDNLQLTHEKNVVAPISNKPLQKLTVLYGSKGGYTPGDAYDFYFGEDMLIEEWVFRKGNALEPSLATTWEDYKDIKGLKVAQKHRNEDGSFLLYFTKVAVKVQ